MVDPDPHRRELVPSERLSWEHEGNISYFCNFWCACMQGYLLDECKVDADWLTLLSLKELGVSCFWKSNEHVVQVCWGWPWHTEDELFSGMALTAMPSIIFIIRYFLHKLYSILLRHWIPSVAPLCSDMAQKPLVLPCPFPCHPCLLLYGPPNIFSKHPESLFPMASL